MSYFDARLPHSDHPLDESAPGGVVISPHSALGKELRRWDLPKRQGGMNADGYEEYPLMLYMARDEGTGKAEVHRQPPPRWAYPAGSQGDAEWTQSVSMAEEFTRRCQRTVGNDDEKAKAMGQGWCLTQDGALEQYEREQVAIGDAAASRHFSDRRMTELARREAQAADDATHEHVADVPAPKKKPGRPKKAEPLNG